MARCAILARGPLLPLAPPAPPAARLLRPSSGAHVTCCTCVWQAPPRRRSLPPSHSAAASFWRSTPGPCPGEGALGGWLALPQQLQPPWRTCTLLYLISIWRRPVAPAAAAASTRQSRVPALSSPTETCVVLAYRDLLGVVPGSEELASGSASALPTPAAARQLCPAAAGSCWTFAQSAGEALPLSIGLPLFSSSPWQRKGQLLLGLGPARPCSPMPRTCPRSAAGAAIGPRRGLAQASAGCCTAAGHSLRRHAGWHSPAAACDVQGAWRLLLTAVRLPAWRAGLRGAPAGHAGVFLEGSSSSSGSQVAAMDVATPASLPLL